jgi:hypothetical protein
MGLVKASREQQTRVERLSCLARYGSFREDMMAPELMDAGGLYGLRPTFRIYYLNRASHAETQYIIR